MSKIKMIGLGLGLMILVGCATTHRLIHRHDNDYLKVAKTLQPSKKADEITKQSTKSDYPVPEGAVAEKKPPSLVPPGSQINYYKQILAAKKLTLAHPENSPLTSTKNTRLLLSITPSKAWGKVKKALKASGYNVLDQDKSISCYYILDAGQTGGKITEKTPILRVDLKANPKGTELIVSSHNHQAIAQTIANRILHAIQKHL